MIMVAPNGARRGKADHPALPLTAAELAADAKACRPRRCRRHPPPCPRCGRRPQRSTPPLYREATAAVRAAAGPASSSRSPPKPSAVSPRPSRWRACARSRPRRCRIALRELVPDEPAEPEAQRFFRWMAASDDRAPVHPLRADEVTRLLDLVDRGVIPWARPFLLLVLGRYTADQQSAPGDLDPFLARLPDTICPGPSAPSGGARPNAPSMPRNRAATSASASRTTSTSPTEPSRRRTPRWSRQPWNCCIRHGFAPMDTSARGP